MGLVTHEDLKHIIEEGNHAVLITQAERVGRELSRQLTTSQIRSIFGSVRQIELDWQAPQRHPITERVRRAQREFFLLQPRLAYQARRERGRGVEELRDILTPALQLVGTDHQRFRNFVDFFEAILAYHKAAGGREQ
ncbi:MAG: type III-A CRISPR-associated protein Csm2 [Chloroflexaceae bacterium]|nr:type III-A CRISPR-associated protein Csm2 [Chloroflexaceae bacterium]